MAVSDFAEAGLQGAFAEGVMFLGRRPAAFLGADRPPGASHADQVKAVERSVP